MHGQDQPDIKRNGARHSRVSAVAAVPAPGAGSAMPHASVEKRTKSARAWSPAIPGARRAAHCLGDVRAVADHGAVDDRAFANPGAGSDHAAGYHRSGPDRGPVEQDGSVDASASADLAAGPDDRPARYLRARLDHGPGQYQRLAARPGQRG